ncbi:MAG TPA: hypothetical protein VIS57_08930 [Xanthomonadales bacterium]
MATKSSIHEEILRLFGPLKDHTVKQIETLEPKLDELEITAAYLAGIDDIMGKERLPLTGKTAKIYEFVTLDETFVDDEYRRE